jgi:tRNA uridine 5-carboxymethylaminomethyl modification enzyme
VSERPLDVLVVGAGHAGCEAALAAARIGCRTMLLTQNLDTVAQLSCNPAVGGVGKGQLVRELDALGGAMARVTDAAGIHFRQLNTSKGQAVRSSRAQVDRRLYRQLMTETVERASNLEVCQGTAARVITRGRTARAVETETGERLNARTIVLAPGTFLDGLVHIGLRSFAAGRLGEAPARLLSDNLRHLGFRLGRFKTGTPPRLDLRTLDLKRMQRQPGDQPPHCFSVWTDCPVTNHVDCYVTYTNPAVHRVVRSGLRRSPLYTGVIKGRGVRYCPSIEDKVVRFGDRDRHHVFIEPEGTATYECYPNGVSTSLPVDLQLEMLHAIPGLGHSRMTRPGYAIEHDYSDPTQLLPTLETRLLRNLYFAGQINGTTGYEEAASQGLVAGANAALRALDRHQFELSRADSYIGVMIDDLITRGTDEPYRMLTARVEYRLLLREDNADLRLSPKAAELGLLSPEQSRRVAAKQRALDQARAWLRTGRIRASASTNRRLRQLGTKPIRESVPAVELLRRPEVTWPDLAQMTETTPGLPESVRRVVELEAKYEGYIARTRRQLAEFGELDSLRLPARLDIGSIPGLSNEVRERLARARPATVGQAQRIPGVTPAAVFALIVHLKARQ